jgi:predicted AAA+ superfamily ATPase
LKIQRKLIENLRQHFKAKEITLLVGARQVGKTTLLRVLQKELEEKGERTLFFNLDIEQDFSYCRSQAQFLAKLELETGGQPATVFIDEIQRKENAGLFLKGLYDMELPHKFVVSGSGSLELKEKIHESLAGRKRLFELWPVSIEEFLQFRTDYRYRDRLDQWLDLEDEKREILLLEYLNYGGYPRVITEQRAEEKVEILQDIFQSYLERDLQVLLGIEKTQAFTLMIRLLADRIGQHTNYSALSKETGLSTPTLKKYLWYAEKTFILKSVAPYFRNASKELTKAPAIYYKDLGLRNLALKLNGKLLDFGTMGMVFENFIFQILSQKFDAIQTPVKYWRTQDQAEVDFIIDRIRSVLPIEVKCRSMEKPKITRSLRSFIDTYQPEEAWIINLSLEKTELLGDTAVRFIPWFKIAI